MPSIAASILREQAEANAPSSSAQLTATSPSSLEKPPLAESEVATASDQQAHQQTEQNAGQHADQQIAEAAGEAADAGTSEASQAALHAAKSEEAGKPWQVSDVERRLLHWHWANLEYGCSAPLNAVSLAHWNQVRASVSTFTCVCWCLAPQILCMIQRLSMHHLEGDKRVANMHLA